jgi:hypothetical protein
VQALAFGSTNVTALKTLAIAAALLAGAASLAIAQTEWSGDKFVLDKASPAPRKASPAPRVPTGGYSTAPGFTFQQSLAQEPTAARTTEATARKKWLQQVTSALCE